MSYDTNRDNVSLSLIGVRAPNTAPAIGSIIYVPSGSGGWDELVISVPAANVRNALGIDNAETAPSWKTTLDATTPAAVDAAGTPGTSLIYSHRDHVHPQDAALLAVDFLVGTATGELSAEIVAGTAPGGELGGTWGTPTVDTTHSGSAHHAAVTLAADADTLLSLSTQELGLDTQTANLVFAGPATGVPADPTFRSLVAADVTGLTSPADADYLVGTAHAGLSAEIVVGTTPGGELGGTWGSPTVDTTHSGSAHHVAVTLGAGSDAILALSGQELTLSDVATQAELDTHAAAADPHTVYRLESADHSHQTTGAQAGTLDHGAALTGLTDDDHTQYALLAGRSGGQTLNGGTASGEDLTLVSTANATKGQIFFGNSRYDEASNELGIRVDPADVVQVNTAVGENFGVVGSGGRTQFEFINDARSAFRSGAFVGTTLYFQPGAEGSVTIGSTTADGQFSTSDRVHIDQSGTGDVELEVSNGVSTGGGTIHRAASATHSSRVLKSHITYLPVAAEEQALADVVGLRHAAFRYLRNVYATKKISRLPIGKKEEVEEVVPDTSVVVARIPDLTAPLRRGLIYEDAPESVRGSGESIVIDDRITNLELAVKAIAKRLGV